MSGQGRQYWAARTAQHRRQSYPTCRGEHDADVVIIGGGLTGCTVACIAATAGLRVVLLEQGRLASGATAASAGVILPEPADSFRSADAAHGLRIAKAAWRQARHGALDLAAVLRRTRVRCDLAPTSLLVNARSAEDAAALRREHGSRRDAGFDAAWMPPARAAAETGTESSGAMRVRDVFTFDPVRAALGLAKAAERRGARIFERADVRRTCFDRRRAEVVLASARIVARQVFVATASPGALFGPLERHFRQQTRFAVVTDPLTVPMRRETGRRASVIAEWGSTPHWLRWLPEDRALFSGHAVPAIGPRQIDKALVAHASELMYELSVRYPVISGLPIAQAWPQTVTATADGLPWIGPHRNYPFHFFALGLGVHGAGLAAFAARAAVRSLSGEAASDDATFVR
ncbi:MAG: FAD-binding oxidoreductase [Acidobacteria bacterium]|nr:FAD-binding oxidoreductase [Acidobacteriota bacterium]